MKKKRKYKRLIQALKNWAETWEGLPEEEQPNLLFKIIKRMEQGQTISKKQREEIIFHVGQLRYI